MIDFKSCLPRWRDNPVYQVRNQQIKQGKGVLALSNSRVNVSIGDFTLIELNLFR
jgi:hypothetical protein